MKTPFAALIICSVDDSALCAIHLTTLSSREVVDYIEA
jgi:hypothetical protein